MTDTQTTFDAQAAVRKAAAAIAENVKAQTERIDLEADEADAVVDLYAAHLAAGGDPKDVPEPPSRPGEQAWERRSRSRLVSYKAALDVVYREWNETRGERANPYSPVEWKKKFQIAEVALDRIGEPMTYSSLAVIGASLAKTSSDEIANVLAELQDTAGRDLVLRRTKIDGKVAYLLRPRVGDEQWVGVRREDGGERYIPGGAASIPLQKRERVAS